MMTWKSLPVMLGSVLALGPTLAGCTSQEAASTSPSVVDKTFALTPETVPVRASFLRGELAGLKVVERVNEATKEVVDQPKLYGMLKLKNTAADQAVRLLSAKIEYTDTGGQPIALAKDRTDTTFKFYTYQTERLDPGMETSQSVDVPFPAAALGARKLGDIRLELTYVAMPYHEETVAVSVSMAK